ncbi:MAG TPA: DUF4126 domain-containing protein [Vicinamibacteria bacterium]|nr:DUF4126 domain-containing protein [Vicinamibacteria bacterium]
MDLGSAWDMASALGLAIGLAACAGLRAWLPLLLAGILGRLGLLTLGSGFHFLQDDRALIPLGVATLLELAADKIPALDHALDVVSTVLRPAAGALLAASMLGRVSDPLISLVLGIAIGAPAALLPHAAKSGLRAASTALTAGLANPVLSLLEDLLAVLLFVLTVVLPLLALLLVAGLTFFVLRRLRRRSRAAA